MTIDETWETSGAVLSFGVCRGSRVVLKIMKQQGDEWHAGEVLRAFDGHGTVKVYESEAMDKKPMMTMTMNNASFDNETFRIQTEDFEDQNGRRITGLDAQHARHPP